MSNLILVHLKMPLLFAAEAEKGYVWWPVWTITFLLVAGLIAFCYTTRAGIVARATTKEAVRQPVFILMMLLSIAFLVISVFVPYFSFGEDVKMLKDCGLATILVSCLLMAVWTSSTSISAEIEGKTTMTLLSKPVNRRQFIVGKYFGILQAVIFLMIPLSLCFLALIYYKVGYDAREAGKQVTDAFEWVDVSFLPFQWPRATQLRWDVTVQIIPGLALIFFEAAILTAISVAIATRAPMIVNIVSCLAIYIVGHLAPKIVETSQENQLLENVQFVSQMIATILPSLEMFNTQTAVATGAIVPPDYIGWSAVYCTAYSTAAVLLAFILFEDHDLA
ncbi:MAG: hypothetical protein Tsb009_26050 [Planctomycetaceae bacterium]